MDTFYGKKLGDAARRLKLLQDRYGRYQVSPSGLGKGDAEDLMGALLEVRGQLKHLQWYGEVNRRGFVKITKKLDKRVAQRATQQRYLETKVDTKQFATNTELSIIRSEVNGWIAALAEVQVRDDASSTHSTESLHRILSKVVSRLPSGLLENAELAVRNDQVQRLIECLLEVKFDDDESVPENLQAPLYLSLLQRAINFGAQGCIDELLSRLPNLEEADDINNRNCVHRLIIAAGRFSPSDDEEIGSDVASDALFNEETYIKPAAPPSLSSRRPAKQETCVDLEQARERRTAKTLNLFLEKLRPQHRSVLRQRDAYGRVPLHYAAQYGLVTLCQILLSCMKSWGKLKSSTGVHAPLWPDNDGYSPLHLSVIGGHPLTTEALLKADGVETDVRTLAFGKSIMGSGDILALAVKANSVAIVKLLIEAGFDGTYQDDQGETALHVAARFGRTRCAEILLTGRGGLSSSTEIADNSFGWTPLHVACVDGHYGVVEVLISAGADLERTDTSGWTPREHAALRGHLEITRRLAMLTSTGMTPALEDGVINVGNGHISSKSLMDQNSTTMNSINTASVTGLEPVKSFGHRYLTDESMILVSLGSMDARKPIEPVNLDRISLAEAHSTQLDTALSVIVSAKCASGEPSIIDLPIQENLSTEPMVFHAIDAASVKLIFDIVPTYAGSNTQVVGRGVALLSTIKPNLGSKRISLQADLSIPIMAASTMEVIGTVNFNFLVITPFKHANMAITEDRTYWKKMASTMLIGHRGLGKNMVGRNSLQLGENTIQSFIAAANLGATYVEFDVQLTKDLVPVIYHDFLVSETGIDAPVHTLTLDQFLHLNDAHASPRHSRVPSPGPSAGPNTPSPNGLSDSRRHRSMSVSDAVSSDATYPMSERMKNTRDFKAKGFKANTRGNFIQGAFTTLEDMFRELPESTGFNIEMKYPMLFESEEQEMDTYAVELNSFVDTVLEKVYDWGGTTKRNIIFSSFNPDICLLLSFKQPSIPVLFLTDAGTEPVGDIRASSLQEAIRFASRWNLLGVVAAAEPLIMCPRLVKVVKESGLVCVSYGTLNNDPRKVQVSTESLSARHLSFRKYGSDSNNLF